MSFHVFLITHLYTCQKETESAVKRFISVKFSSLKLAHERKKKNINNLRNWKMDGPANQIHELFCSSTVMKSILSSFCSCGGGGD